MKMKSKLLAIALLAVIVGFGACGGGGGDDDETPGKSNACDITKFTAGGKDWTITGLNITATFEKEDDITNLVPTITFSEKATISPLPSVAQDFSKDVPYTVTAENGTTTKTYTARATKQ